MKRKPFDPNRVQVPPEESNADTKPGVLTVSQVTARVKRALNAALPGSLHVVGQISNFTRHSSGHIYLTLKDDASELSCVMWRSAAKTLKFTAEDGMEVIATGRIDVYERSGRYQLYIHKLEPRGIGALELAFQQLREKLAGQGLFDAERKRPLPRYPGRVAVVTSPTGAALRDIVQTIERRYPCMELLLYPVRVQGETAAAEIAEAIRQINANAKALGGIDVMIVGRGGGSLEDLWAFNEEPVARAIYKSRIPVVSAVGHEVDVTIADLTADVRAATPTAAAELVAPQRLEVLADLHIWADRMFLSIKHRVSLGQARLEGMRATPYFSQPLSLIQRHHQTLDERLARLQRIITARVSAIQRTLHQARIALQTIHPLNLLARMRTRLALWQHRLDSGCRQRRHHAQRLLDRRTMSLKLASPARHLAQHEKSISFLQKRHTAALDRLLTSLRRHLDNDLARLENTSHRATLRRGFSITRTRKGKMVVTDPGTLRDGDHLRTETARGEFESQVINVHQLELFE